jgi:heme-degrading monooxygenase HmoA
MARASPRRTLRLPGSEPAEGVPKMYARVNTFEGDPQTLDAQIADVEQVTLPGAQSIPGFEGMLVLVDRGSGKTLAVTLWTDERAMRASEDAASALRNESAARNRERIVSVERFEVVLTPEATRPQRATA